MQTNYIVTKKENGNYCVCRSDDKNKWDENGRLISETSFFDSASASDCWEWIDNYYAQKIRERL